MESCETLPFQVHTQLCAMCVLLCAYHVLPGTCGGQRKVLDPLEMESEMVVSFHVGSGNLAQVLWKSSQCS